MLQMCIVQLRVLLFLLPVLLLLSPPLPSAEEELCDVSERERAQLEQAVVVAKAKVAQTTAVAAIKT